jgi:carbon storage regulator CsrA
MLVLSRKLNERLVFPGFGTFIQILGIRSKTVRLGIEAPPAVDVFREEVYNAKHGSVAAEKQSVQPDQPLCDLVLKRLDIAAEGLEILADQLGTGAAAEALSTLEGIREEVAFMKARIHQPMKSLNDPAWHCRALLVEHDRNERELLASYLRMAGIEVDVAGDGCAALEYLRRPRPPDVVLLDMGLPRCDGATAVRIIRGNPELARLKIIAVSGHSPEEFEVACGRKGVDRWFLKPIDPAALLRDIERIAARPAKPR